MDYPVEEAVVNAVYHRSYEIREPIEVRINPDEIMVMSISTNSICCPLWIPVFLTGCSVKNQIVLLAKDLGKDPDFLLALSGRVSSDLQEVIRNRPVLFAQLIRQLKDLPDHAVLRIVREVRDGDW